MSDKINDVRKKELDGDFVPLLEHKKMIHDVRNGLSAILMQAQLLSLYTENGEPATKTIKTSAKAIEQSVKEIVMLFDDPD